MTCPMCPCIITSLEHAMKEVKKQKKEVINTTHIHKQIETPVCRFPNKRRKENEVSRYINLTWTFFIYPC